MFWQTRSSGYEPGEVLTAELLNQDFNADRRVLAALAGRYSDGIIAGMRLIAKDHKLWLKPGIFQIAGVIGSLESEMPVELPPYDSWQKLWLAQADSGWRLFWSQTEEADICLARLKASSSNLLQSSWLDRDKIPETFQAWELSLSAVNSIQMEYAMAASLSSSPTLLPEIQHKLAFLAPAGLRLWLLNGIFPLLAYYNQKDWGEALQKFREELTGDQQVKEATSRSSRVIYP